MLVLRILTGNNRANEYDLEAPKTSVGSSVADGVLLGDDSVLPQHAVLERTEQRYLVRSLARDATRRVKVNGERVDVEFVEAGDILAFGSILAILVAADDARPPETSTPYSDLPYESPVDERTQIQLRLSGDDVARLLFGEDTRPDPGPGGSRHRLRVIYAINSILKEKIDISVLLARVLEVVMEATNAERGAAMAQTGGGPAERLIITRRAGAEGFVADEDFRISRTIMEHVLHSGEAVLTADASQDKRFHEGSSIHTLRIRSAMCAPLRGRQAVQGMLFVEADPKIIFTEESLQLLACVADMSGKVIESARLVAQDMERRRLATIGRTLASTAHYIKNLLTGITAGADLVDIGLADEDLHAVQVGWRPIRASMSVLNDLVLNMLDYSRDGAPVPQEVYLPDLVESLVALLRQRAESRRVRIETELEPDLPRIQADSVALHRALLNLLANGLEAIPLQQEGRLLLAVRRVPGEKAIQVQVRDDGIGIPPALLPNIWDLFFSSKGNRGTGFGLAVTKKIVEQHHGYIELESEVGLGTTFTLVLPLRPPLATADPFESSPQR